MRPLFFLIVALTLTAALHAQQYPEGEWIAPLSSSHRQQPPKQTDTVTIEIPFFDDFSNYEGLPDPKRWLSSDAFVNSDYGPLPPTVGMVTLDALNANGDLYPQASTNTFTADTLASQFIRLDSITGTYRRQLHPSDSLYLSFFYLPGGWYGDMWERIGTAPSQQDSLFLDFYTPADSQWHTVWAIGGHNADTAGVRSRWPWRYVAVKIDDMRFFTNRFQFRFRNYASLDKNPKAGIAGNCDQWNIDYIYLNYNRTAGDSTFRDVAFVEKAPSMLKHYQAMPARQFAASEMADNVSLKIVNRYNQTLASNYSYTVFNANNQAVGHYDGGYENINPFFPNGQYQTMPVHCNPPVNFTYPIDGTTAEYRVVHVVREGVGGDNHISNDTITFLQRFSNYYAYDDGVPENGYGLTATGSRVWLAQRYDLNVADTLSAVDLFFNRTRNGENEDITFQICIWSCRHGKPYQLLYKDSEKMSPAFDGFNRYHRYPLTTPVTVDDTIFVGFEQLSSDYINLGFDRNNDSRHRLYYRTNNEWSQSILSGSVMMRPLFGTAATVGITPAATAEETFTVYPNPAHTLLNLRFADSDSHTTVTCFNGRGSIVMQLPMSSTIDVSHLPSGLYLLRISDANGKVKASKKIIISH